MKVTPDDIGEFVKRASDMFNNAAVQISLVVNNFGDRSTTKHNWQVYIAGWGNSREFPSWESALQYIRDLDQVDDVTLEGV